jgi:hypothetical protein
MGRLLSWIDRTILSRTAIALQAHASHGVAPGLPAPVISNRAKSSRR